MRQAQMFDICLEAPMSFTNPQATLGTSRPGYLRATMRLYMKKPETNYT